MNGSVPGSYHASENIELPRGVGRAVSTSVVASEHACGLGAGMHRTSESPPRGRPGGSDKIDPRAAGGRPRIRTFCSQSSRICWLCRPAVRTFRGRDGEAGPVFGHAPQSVTNHRHARGHSSRADASHGRVFIFKHIVCCINILHTTFSYHMYLLH